MSEVAVEVPGTLERDYHPTESYNSSAETIDKRVAELDRVLTPLVSANAGVLVECPWLGNSKVTLREAMVAYPTLMINEDPHMLAGIVMELLAKRVTEVEEDEKGKTEEEEGKSKQETSQDDDTAEPEEKPPAKTNEVEQNKNAQTKTSKEQASPKIVSDEKPKTMISEGQNLPDYRTETLSKTQNNSSAAAAAESGRDAKPVNRDTPPATQAKTASSPSESSAHTTSPDSAGGSEPATTRGASETPAQKSDIEVISAQDKLETVTEHEGPANNSPDEAEPAAEITELSSSDIESQAIADDAAGLADEKPAEAESEPTLTALDYQIGADGLINFAQEEILPDNPIEDGLDADEQNLDIARLEFTDGELVAGEEAILIPRAEDILVEPEQTETTNAEQPEQTDINFEDVQDLLAVLSERIESSQPEAAKAANELLDKIDGVLAKLETADGENIINEAQIQEELEELFTELFDNLGIDYTPKLIKSLALLTVKLHLADRIGKLEEEETDETPQDNGTHEIIKKLLVGSNTIKKAMSQAWAIGKSALCLYSNRILVEEYLTR